MQKAKMNFAVLGVAALMAFLVIEHFSSQPPKPARDTALQSAVNWLLESERREKVVDLPEDGSSWWTVFVWPENKEADPYSRQLSANFAATPRLQSLLAQTKVHNFEPSDRLYQGKYEQYLGGQTPAVLVQRDDGKVAYKASGANIPTDGVKLADDIAKSIEQCFPRPRPKPTPTPSPTPQPGPSIVPDIRPDEPEEEESSDDFPLLLLLLPFLGAGAGAFREFKKE